MFSQLFTTFISFLLVTKSPCGSLEQTSPWNLWQFIKNISKLWNDAFHAWRGWHFEWVDWSQYYPCLSSSSNLYAHPSISCNKPLMGLPLIMLSLHTWYSQQWISVVLCHAYKKKKDHTTELIAVRIDSYRIHVYSVATHVQLNKMDSRLAFSEIALYLLLQETHCITLTTGLFFPANWRLILELPSYNVICQFFVVLVDLLSVVMFQFHWQQSLLQCGLVTFSMGKLLTKLIWILYEVWLEIFRAETSNA